MLVVNGTPVAATRLIGKRGEWPIDRGCILSDGQPLFGRSKTWRGLALAVAATTAAAAALGLPWTTGAIFGIAAMVGDLGSSFIKRRLGLGSGSMAPGIDQMPEALPPLVACHGTLGLGLGDILLATAMFSVGELPLSRLLFRLGIRERPY